MPELTIVLFTVEKFLQSPIVGMRTNIPPRETWENRLQHQPCSLWDQTAPLSSSTEMILMKRCCCCFLMPFRCQSCYCKVNDISKLCGQLSFPILKQQALYGANLMASCDSHWVSPEEQLQGDDHSGNEKPDLMSLMSEESVKTPKEYIFLIMVMLLIMQYMLAPSDPYAIHTGIP